MIDPPTTPGMQRFTRRSTLKSPVEEVFSWHERPGAMDRLMPPWQSATIEQAATSLQPGSQAVIKLHLGPLSIRWVAEHTEYDRNRLFRDVQRSGPFAAWDHRHRFESLTSDRCVIEDDVTYRLPIAWLTQPLVGRLVHRQLARMFAYRHRIAREDVRSILAAEMLRGRQNASPLKPSPMRILVAGSSGLVGSRLVPYLATAGHHVVRLLRGTSSTYAHTISWDPDAGVVNPTDLEGFDAVIHLGGANIAGLWTRRFKQRIRESRVRSTTVLAKAIAALRQPPAVFMCASAVGWYGCAGDRDLIEDQPAGKGFLPDVAREWEAAADLAASSRTRVIKLRSGMILSAAGGPLKTMLLPFKLGLAGPIGSGSQYWPWVSIDDVVGAILFLLSHPAAEGPVNLVAPHTVTNREFTKTLGRVLRRPTIVSAPGFAVRLLVREMAEAVLLCSQRVLPARLETLGFEFRQPSLEDALRHLLGRPNGP